MPYNSAPASSIKAPSLNDLRHPVQAFCFDYFDTLVSRSVAPEDVKRLWAEGVARSFPGILDGPALYTLRNRLETAHCERDRAAGMDSEFRATELYADLWDQASQLQGTPQTDFVDLALDLEVSLELSVQQVNPEVAALVEQLFAKGTVCWLVSDFYLGSEAFETFLVHHGLRKFFSRLFVSSDTFTTKRAGGMYARVIEAAGVPPEQLVMIGDNEYSDYQKAKAAGLQVVKIDASAQHAQYAEWAKRSADHAATIAEAKGILVASPLVFKELALTLYWFIDLLHARLLREQAQDVFFLAREGQFLKALFDQYQGTRQFQGRAFVRSHYLEVSRRSTMLPSLQTLHEEKFETLFRQYRRISVLDFLSSLGLQDIAPQIALGLGIQPEVAEEDLPTSDAFNHLLADDLFQRTYERERLARRKAFIGYVHALAPDASGLLHLVDVGWKGTIQDNIYNLLTAEPTGFDAVQGHYIGLVASGALSARNHKDGLVFSCVGKTSKNFSVFNENRSLFEVVLAADHGSAFSYVGNADGSIDVVRQDFPEEPLFRGKIEPMQRQLFDLFKPIDRLFHERVLSQLELERLVTHAHARMLFQPTPAEIDWFENVYHVENFGLFVRSTFASGKQSPSLLDKLRFYRALRRQINTDQLGFWPMLTCLQQGGRLVASRYAKSRLQKIED